MKQIIAQLSGIAVQMTFVVIRCLNVNRKRDRNSDHLGPILAYDL